MMTFIARMQVKPGKEAEFEKLAKRLTERDRKKVLMASLDVNRPAAMECSSPSSTRPPRRRTATRRTSSNSRRR